MDKPEITVSKNSLVITHRWFSLSYAILTVLVIITLAFVIFKSPYLSGFASGLALLVSDPSAFNDHMHDLGPFSVFHARHDLFRRIRHCFFRLLWTMQNGKPHGNQGIAADVNVNARDLSPGRLQGTCASMPPTLQSSGYRNALREPQNRRSHFTG